MEMSNLQYLVPQPLRDVGYQARAMYKADEWSTSNIQFSEATKKMTMVAFRLAIVGLAFVAARKYNYNQAPSTVAAAVISVPATLIGWGSKLLYDGARSMYKNILSRSFSEAGKGFGMCAVGYVMLEFNNRESLRNIFDGLGEKAVKRMLRVDY